MSVLETPYGTCEVCGEPVAEPDDHGPGSAYVEVTTPSDAGPAGSTTFAFCSLEHAALFFHGTEEAFEP